jgi:hypothetical protein
MRSFTNPRCLSHKFPFSRFFFPSEFYLVRLYLCTRVETNVRIPRINISTGTDIASSFCIPAEAVVSSLKHVRAGSFAPVFVAIDTRSAAAFGKNRLPTAMHVPVLAEDAVSIAYFYVSNSVSLCCVLRSYRIGLKSFALFLQGLVLHPPVSHVTSMRQAIEKILPLNGRRHLCLIMSASYDEAPQDERAGVIRLITLMRRRGVRCVDNHLVEHRCT